MTSLHETLPILDQAVPALPERLQEIAREGDTFHQAAAGAVAMLDAKRQQAEALVEQVRQALTSLRDQLQDQQAEVEKTATALREATEQEVQEVGEAEAALGQEGEQAVAALGSLQSRVEEAEDRTRTAQEEASTALDGLGEALRDSEPELDAAVDEMAAAVTAAQQAVAAGHALVEQGVGAVREAMSRLVGEAQARLKQTHQSLDDVRKEQGRAVNEALDEMATEREQIEEQVVGRLERAVRKALADELETVGGGLAQAGQRVLEHDSATESRREELARAIGEVEERIGPMQAGVQEVKRAAEKVGLEWT